LGSGVVGLRRGSRVRDLLSKCGAGLKLADGFEHFSQVGFADLALEFVLHPVEGGNDAQGASLALRLEREEIGTRILGIDFALQKAFGL
jgi:hypothetical protein